MSGRVSAPTGPRQSHEPEVIGATVAAKMIGVQQPNLRKLKGLPTPYQKVPRGTLWRRTDIERFAAEKRAAHDEGDQQE
jgi:hypothetical protein